jgi:dihydrofolate reductase
MQIPEWHCTDRLPGKRSWRLLAQFDTWLRVPAGVPSPAFLAPPTESRISQLALGVTRAHNQYAAPPPFDMKLTVQTFLTLDGVMQAPGGSEEDPSDAFTHGGWQAPFPDPAIGEFITELNSRASAFLLGRRTFDIFRGYWPDQTDPADPIATAINSLPKYVVSKSLSEADAMWRGEHPDTARLMTGDVVAAVQALKDEPGDELQIWGSSNLLQTLLQHELVDRFRLMTYPLVIGSGRRLFNEGIAPATMRPIDVTVTELGIVIGTYEPAGPVRHGQM